MTTKLLGVLGLLIAFAGLAFGGGYLIFHQTSYDPPATSEVAFPDTTVHSLPANPAREHLAAVSPGALMVVDAAHRNSYRQSEISVLLSRIASRGAVVEYIGDFRTTEAAKRVSLLEESLRRADALLVILPRDAYTVAEADLVERFVRKGGKLLLISDPTRIHQMNSLAERFGVNFQPDFLFNQHEHDLNFQNIFVRQFQPDEITSGVNSIALYSAGSIQTSGSGIAFTDGLTESSVSPSGVGLSPIAWGDSRNVLAVGDFTFIIPPHNAALDNDQLLSNIADFATASSREFVLSDFPSFFQGGSSRDVQVMVGQASLFGSGTAVKNGLSENGIVSKLTTVEDFSSDTVFLGLHEDAQRVGGYLQTAGIRVDDSLSGPFGEDLGLEGTAVAVLDRTSDRHILILLADTPETLSKAVAGLFDGNYRQDLVNDFASVTSFATESK